MDIAIKLLIHTHLKLPIIDSNLTFDLYHNKWLRTLEM